MNANESYIAVSRVSEDMFGVFRQLQVFIDGESVGSVRHDAREAFEVAPGEHRLEVKMDWCRSEPVTVHVSNRQTIEFFAHSRHKTNMFMNMIGVALWPRRFFLIRPAA